MVDTCIGLLDCDEVSIRLLIQQGHLEYTNSEFGVRITKESFDRFHGKFMSMKAISRIKKLTGLCDEIVIDRLMLDQNHASLRNTFIRRQYLPLLAITALDEAA